MKKWWMMVATAAVLLSACGEGKESTEPSTEQAAADKTVYDETFTHEMEGVHVTMDGYTVETLDTVTEEQQQNGIAVGERIMQADMTVQNDTTTPIYFSPDVYIMFDNEQLANEAERLALGHAVKPALIAPAAYETFTIAFRLGDAAQQTATMQIPVAFTEANSTSSGDALGDIGEWHITLR